MNDLEAFMSAATSRPDLPGLRLYALVDHAGAPGLLGRLHERTQTARVNLFEGSREDGAIDVAPFLLDLETITQKTWLQWLYSACRESTSLTLLHSSHPLQALARSLKRRLDVVLPDNVPALLRYFDTRILESLAGLLDEKSKSKFFGIAARWQWLDRGGSVCRHDGMQTSEDAWPPFFKISEALQNALVEAAEADSLVQQMWRQSPDLCRGRTRAELHSIADNCIAQMAHWSIEDAPSRTLYALTALQHGVLFAAQPAWAKALGRVQRKEVPFHRLLADMGI